MNLDKLFFDENEKPLANIPADGGFVGIFRRMVVIGDSLSAGQFEAVTPERTIYRDMHDYSWGQNLGRIAGCEVLDFSGGGITAKWYCEEFEKEKDIWNPDHAAQAYLLALGVNDVICAREEPGSVEDIDLSDWRNNKDTYAGWFGKIIQRYKEIQPKAKFFLLTMPHDRGDDGEQFRLGELHAELMYALAELFDNTYVIDLRKYAPPYDAGFRERFYMFGHMNPMGYILTAKMVAAYIDYIIRHNMKDFIQVPFIGTPYYMENLEK